MVQSINPPCLNSIDSTIVLLRDIKSKKYGCIIFNFQLKALFFHLINNPIGILLIFYL